MGCLDCDARKGCVESRACRMLQVARAYSWCQWYWNHKDSVRWRINCDFASWISKTLLLQAGRLVIVKACEAQQAGFSQGWESCAGSTRASRGCWRLWTGPSRCQRPTQPTTAASLPPAHQSPNLQLQPALPQHTTAWLNRYTHALLGHAALSYVRMRLHACSKPYHSH